MRVKEMLEKAISTPGGVVIRSESKEALQTIRYHIYSERRKDRTLTKQTMPNSNVGGSRFDPLIVSIKKDDKSYVMRIIKEDDLFSGANMAVEVGNLFLGDKEDDSLSS